MVALQTTEAVVPGSDLASLTVEISEYRQSHCVYCKILGQRGRPPPETKKYVYKTSVSDPNPHKDMPPGSGWTDLDPGGKKT